MRWRVDDAGAGVRLDAFVARAAGVSVRAARALVGAGAVRVAGRRAAKGARLRVGDEVEADEARLAEKRLAPVLVARPEVPLVVLYEDEHLVAVDKPAGLPSHPLRAGEGASAAAALVARYPECAAAALDGREGGLGHRLDRGTSGVLVAARNRASWLGLRRALSTGAAEKSYLAEVVGRPPRSETITAAIGHAGRRGGRAAVGRGRGTLPAETHVERLFERADTSIVRARLATGRLHQVRVHLAHAGFPILGDALYGDEHSLKLGQRLGVHEVRLFAESVRFVHPVSGRPIIIEAPPPAWARAS